MSSRSFGPLVQAEWLRDHLDDDLRMIDVRWYPTGRPGREAYLEGHIPGGVYVDLDSEVTGVGGPGRHPLPTREQFERAMRKAGVSRGSRVVVYDDSGGSIAARIRFLLRLFGHDEVAVLDGGLAAWGEPLSKETAGPAEGDFKAAEPAKGETLDFEQVSARPPEWLLIDARAPERYEGKHEPLDPQAGHIPGAVNACWAENLGPGGRFLPSSELRKRYEERGADDSKEIVVYCGSGVTACHDLLALELAGFSNTKLYAGSWSDWSSRPEAPIATGSTL
jgi:thiosulfate/3-mercaptopyruvate sulfurtransferase